MIYGDEQLILGVGDGIYEAEQTNLYSNIGLSLCSLIISCKSLPHIMLPPNKPKTCMKS